MTWRYQPVFTDVVGAVTDGTRDYGLIEVYFDDEGRLEMWTALDPDDAFASPVGETTEELTRDLFVMTVDTACWKPVAYIDLEVGMKFEEAIKVEDRNNMIAFVKDFTRFIIGNSKGEADAGE
jgi:hypothetical protein